MRVTIAIGGLGDGGAERVCVNLANAWAAAGHDVTIVTITYRSPESVYPLAPEVARVDVRWPEGVRADDEAAAIAETLQERGAGELTCEALMMAAIRAGILPTHPDVVVSHMDLTNMRVISALAGTGIPIVACEHTDPSRVSLGPWQGAREVLYRYAAGVVAPHESIAEWFTRRGIAARAIPNALLPPPRPRSRGAAAPAAGGRRRVVTLARLSPEKRVGTIVGAFRRVAADFPEWDLEIYGDGPDREWFRRETDARVHVHGFTTDPYGVLATADLYASASQVEGFGNAVWEALACGVPVVALDCGAPMRTLVRDGVDGIIMEGGEASLAMALARLMGDDALREEYAARAAEAPARYPFERALELWDDVLCGAAAVHA